MELLTRILSVIDQDVRQYELFLFLAPSGKPVITTAHNTSATSLHISWRPPHHDTIHGEFLGYRITYRPRDRSDRAFEEIYIRDPTVEVSNCLCYVFREKKE